MHRLAPGVAGDIPEGELAASCSSSTVMLPFWRMSASTRFRRAIPRSGCFTGLKNAGRWTSPARSAASGE